ncbi:hypothetical protein HB943_14385 [Listeria weihenstephanensis]|uniref:YdhG-like domain-containing protein n=1 Tax=Listeria weihenstephanensis TaxID=1006155 RepID=A0A841ZB93_9LIST|nr:YdeI family protein [Listeria weihenstephanensis]MBC1501786.1 hypothetical protein [Listeria weihenstephanensis]
MTESKINPKVDEYLSKPRTWQEEFIALTKMARASGLTEEFKWGKPCYAFEGNNVFLIHGFKEYCAILFMKGALLKDPKGILVQQTENVQSSRQIRFTNLEEIVEMEPFIKAYIDEAIEVEKSGVEVEFKKHEEFAIPVELQNKFEEIPNLQEAFEKLTPGRQRGYILYFSAPKQSKTRDSRIDKYVDRIIDGIGLNDRY